jgi:hypothetical protein
LRAYERAPKLASLIMSWGYYWRSTTRFVITAIKTNFTRERDASLGNYLMSESTVGIFAGDTTG